MRKSQESQVPTDGIRQLFGHHVILLVLAVGSDTYPIEGIKYWQSNFTDTITTTKLEKH